MTFLQLVWKNKTIFIHKGKHPQEFLSVLSTCMINEGFTDSSVGKESACSAGDPGSILGLGRSPGERIGYPLQYSGLENSMGLQRVRHN